MEKNKEMTTLQVIGEEMKINEKIKNFVNFYRKVGKVENTEDKIFLYIDKNFKIIINKNNKYYKVYKKIIKEGEKNEP